MHYNAMLLEMIISTSSGFLTGFIIYFRYPVDVDLSRVSRVHTSLGDVSWPWIAASYPDQRDSRKYV